MRAAIAVRVSPRPQENVRYSPEIQEQKCREWCAANGHEVVTVVQDILVSGGSSKRFDSIFAAMEQHRPELWVVSDLSRWTRDRPSRFWAIKALLEDQGVELVSVDDPMLGSDVPFSDTLTTARVEMNYQERERLRAKTSEGVRKAWAAGKRWGRPFGWTWHPREPHKHDGEDCWTLGVWTQDVDLIRRFYQDWVDGRSGYEMSRLYGMFETNIRQALRARCQRDIIGADLWETAQTARRIKGIRRDLKRSSIYRGLLICPFCGGTLQHATHWGHYKCHRFHLKHHDWWSLSARLYVTPEVRRTLDSLTLRDPTETRPEPAQGKARDLEKETERLTIAWVKGRLSTERYESLLADIERSRPERLPARPPERIAELVNDLSLIDLEDRDPETGNLTNEMLRLVIDRIEVRPDRTAEVVLADDVSDWVYRS